MTATPQVVLVTGSSSGFGRLAVETLARRGHTVFASMRGINGKNAQAAEELRAVAQAEGLVLELLELDVTDDTSVQQAIQSLIAQAGRIDAVINNAGFGVMGITEASSIAQVQYQFDVNLFGVLRVNQAVLPHMRRQHSGLLVYVSSIASRLGSPPSAWYCATKAALDAVARSFSYELREFGIDTTIIQPGMFATAFGTNMTLADRPEVAAEYPLMSKQVDSAIAGLSAAFAGETPGADDPQRLADLIAELVEQPQGQRPLYSAMGYGSEQIHGANAGILAYEQVVMQAFGLNDPSVATDVAAPESAPAAPELVV